MAQWELFTALAGFEGSRPVVEWYWRRRQGEGVELKSLRGFATVKSCLEDAQAHGLVRDDSIHLVGFPSPPREIH